MNSATRLQVICLSGNDALRNLAAEEQLFTELRAEPRPVLLFYVNSPCVVLGRANRADEWADEAALRADGVPLLRRFSGGGAVYHDLDNLNYSFILPRPLLDSLLPGPQASRGPAHYIDFFRGLVIRALERSGQRGYAAVGISDIALNGRKISGNAQRIASTLVLHHGTLLRHCPLTAIERYLRIPPNRSGVPHRGFVTSLADEGRTHTAGELQLWLIDEACASVGLELDIAEPSPA